MCAPSGLRYSLLPGESQHSLSRDFVPRFERGKKDNQIWFCCIFPFLRDLAKEMSRGKETNARRRRISFFLSGVLFRGGRKELACGGQAFIATSLFDPSTMQQKAI
jgi:hypothetical protein